LLVIKCQEKGKNKFMNIEVTQFSKNFGVLPQIFFSLMVNSAKCKVYSSQVITINFALSGISGSTVQVIKYYSLQTNSGY